MSYAIGIDIGGTNTRVALIDESFNIIERIQFDTDRDNPDETIRRIADAISHFEGSPIGIGMSCPGPLDLINGKILVTPNLGESWWGYDITGILESLIKIPVYLENDANLAALAEAVIGEGRNYRYVQFFTVSTGIGSGQVIDRKIYRGAHGFAHEVAQICMWEGGPSQGEIISGGIEAISSGSAITKRALDRGLNVNHAGDVNRLALDGNEDALEIMTDAKVYLANMIAAVISVTDPEIVILGGSVALKIDGFVEELEGIIKERVFKPLRPLIRLRKSTLDEDSGLLGAAALVFENCKEDRNEK